MPSSPKKWKQYSVPRSKSARYLMTSVKQNKSFYLARLRNASLPELVYRTGQLLLTRRLKCASKTTKAFIDIPTSSDVSALQLPSLKCGVTPEMVKEILNGRVHTLGADRADLAAWEEQHRGTFFSDIEIEAPDRTDIRAVWEPARLQHLAILLAYMKSPSPVEIAEEITNFCDHAISRWIDTNPFSFGPHYVSAMECGLRIPVFFLCLKLLYPEDPTKSHLLLTAIYQHGWWISKRLSLYSSVGNHTIAESVGLIFAGALFRETKEGKQWIEKGFSILKGELEHQILEDGGPAEQSLNYHRFVLDLYWLSVDFLEKNNLYDCSDIKPRLMRGEDFLDAFQHNGGNMPLIGDSDDGCAVAPGIAPRRPKTNRIEKGIKVFKDSGYTVINTENKVTVTFDHGPLGMPPLYNHGHADALSITLTKEGRQILIDPGTYRYNGVPEWRRYFKGTRAHNTVTIDGLDQAVQETRFVWSHPYKVDLLNYSEQSDGLFVEAAHNGYSRLKEPVWHKRSILFFRETNFIIKDSFTGRGVHDFELNYHVHPDATVSKSDDWWCIEKTETNLFVMLLGEDEFSFVHGQGKPLLGWYSPSYGIKRKSGVLNCIKTGVPGEISFVTVICTESQLDKTELEERANKI